MIWTTRSRKPTGEPEEHHNLLKLRRLVFSLSEMLGELPGDLIWTYVSLYKARMFSLEELQLLRQKYGLDKPLAVQYADWFSNLFHGELGH